MIKTIGWITANYCRYCEKKLDNWNDLFCYDCNQRIFIKSEIPENPKMSEIYYNKNNKTSYVWDGFAWNEIFLETKKNKIDVDWYKCEFCHSRYDYKKHSNCPNCGGV